MRPKRSYPQRSPNLGLVRKKKKQIFNFINDENNGANPYTTVYDSFFNKRAMASLYSTADQCARTKFIARNIVMKTRH